MAKPISTLEATRAVNDLLHFSAEDRAAPLEVVEDCFVKDFSQKRKSFRYVIATYDKRSEK